MRKLPLLHSFPLLNNIRKIANPSVASHHLVLLVLFVVSSLLSPSVTAQRTCQIYFTDVERNKISRSNADGTGITDLITGQNSIVAVQVDAQNNQLYWGRNNIKDIRRSNLDGSSETVLVANPNPTGFSLLRDIQIDVAGGKIYWSDSGIAGSTPVIMRANLDGTMVETLISNEDALSIDLDLVNQKIYFSNNSTTKRANLDGTMVESVIHEGGKGLLVDTDNGKVYWINGTSTIKRASLNGTNVESLVNSSSTFFDLALDTELGKIYWTNSTDRIIQRANVDGTMVETIIPSPSSGSAPGYRGIALVCTATVQVASPIPTMSQWGLVLFGLLILNCSVFLLRGELPIAKNNSF
ncbi:MAG: hypothetical protein AAF960_03600 [Bacteroidota bacterium]